MEDVLVLHDMMQKYPNDRKKAFEEYSKFRNPDAEAMCDLAMYNYIEMRDLTARKSFLLRKYLDNFLYWLVPKVWVPLYTSVTFTRMRYHQCIKNKAWQDEVRNYSVKIVSDFLPLGFSVKSILVILKPQHYSQVFFCKFNFGKS